MEMSFGVDDAENWTYRGEGALNLVLAYTGTSTQLIGKVLRIQKKAGQKQRSSDNPLTDEERILWKEDSELARCQAVEMVDQLYASLVMSPLLGPGQVDPGVRVRVSREFLNAIGKKTASHRPPSRVEAAQIDATRAFAILMSDHSLFPPGGSCLCVEIKPKCGFLPSSKYLADQFAFKRTVTRYKMHQHLKLHQHEISVLSHYDPLDLFSGERERIGKAMIDLYATPQNNFRVFLNGSLIFGGLGGGTTKTDSEISEAFEQELNNIISPRNGSAIDNFIQLVADTVHRSGVLNRLLQVQMLDKLDIEGAIHAYYNILSLPCSVCDQISKAGSAYKYASLHTIGLDESIKIVKDYLIAATAKDCSIMISFKPASDDDIAPACDNSIHISSLGQTFYYKVNFIDLDLKSLWKMEDYYKLDQKILKHYSQMMKVGK